MVGEIWGVFQLKGYTPPDLSNPFVFGWPCENSKSVRLDRNERAIVAQPSRCLVPTRPAQMRSALNGAGIATIPLRLSWIPDPKVRFRCRSVPNLPKAPRSPGTLGVLIRVASLA